MIEFKTITITYSLIILFWSDNFQSFGAFTSYCVFYRLWEICSYPIKNFCILYMHIYNSFENLWLIQQLLAHVPRSLHICSMTSVTDRRKKTPTFPQRERQHQEKAEGGRGLMVRTTLPPSVTRKKSCLMCVCDRNNAFWICFQKNIENDRKF